MVPCRQFFICPESIYRLCVNSGLTRGHARGRIRSYEGLGKIGALTRNF
jgi:hypothetical protein